MFSGPLRAQESLDDLFALLAQPDLPNWEMVEEKIWQEWSRSGSASMDLLLQRGKDALESGDYGAAIEHFTALTDHAPEFAEGWNGLASAYFQIGQYGPALEYLRTALALNPRHFGAMTGLAVILEEIGEPEQALEILQRIRAIHPQRPDVIAAIARLEARVGGQDI